MNNKQIINTIGQQLAAMRKTVTKVCTECGSEFTGLAAKNADTCQKCRRKAIQKKYRDSQTGERS